VGASLSAGSSGTESVLADASNLIESTLAKLSRLPVFFSAGLMGFAPRWLYTLLMLVLPSADCLAEGMDEPALAKLLALTLFVSTAGLESSRCCCFLLTQAPQHCILSKLAAT
jgi:hypothetical protein